MRFLARAKKTRGEKPAAKAWSSFSPHQHSPGSPPTKWCTQHPSSHFSPAQTPLSSHRTCRIESLLCSLNIVLFVLESVMCLWGKKWMNDLTIHSFVNWSNQRSVFFPRKSLRKGWECGSVGRMFTWHAWSPGLGPQHRIIRCDQSCLVCNPKI